MIRKFAFYALQLATLLSYAEEKFTGKWENTHFVWNFSIAMICDKGFPQDPIAYLSQEPIFNEKAYEGIAKGDLVWVQCQFVGLFAKTILPKIKDPFILVVSDGDESFPSEAGLANVEEFLQNEKILHIFAQNCDYKGSSTKITHLPIGLDYHTVAYKNPSGGWGEKGSPKKQEEQLQAILSRALPTLLRKPRAFVDFQISDTMHAGHKRYLLFGEDRASIFQRLLSQGVVDYADWMRRSALWEIKKDYVFSISPHGNGLDCHRTWHDLALGCIVIVKKSTLDPLYEGLPVVIVDDWSEITQDNLFLWMREFADLLDKQTYVEKLKTSYWHQKMRQVQAQAR